MLQRIISRYRRQFWSGTKYARHLGVKVGDNCSIASRNFGTEPYLIEIGNHVQITSGVNFANHGAAWVFREKYPKMDFFGKIKVGNNVYIGNNAIILPGVKIGDDVIIGAGSVVTKSIPSNCIVGGNPAKIIGKVDQFKDRIAIYNLKTKGLSYEDKRKVLLTSPDERFFTKSELKI